MSFRQKFCLRFYWLKPFLTLFSKLLIVVVAENVFANHARSNGDHGSEKNCFFVEESGDIRASIRFIAQIHHGFEGRQLLVWFEFDICRGYVSAMAEGSAQRPSGMKQVDVLLSLLR